MLEKLKQYCLLLRLHKPIGILLLLWPTLWALWIAAQGCPPLGILGIFIAGVILVRSLGCVINDIADRDIDKHVARTQHRPLTAGKVSLKEALIIFIILSLIALSLVLLLNRLTLYFSFAAILVTIVYPFTKRFTHFPQLILGIAFAFGVPMAFSAVLGYLPGVAGLLFLATYCWIVAYDTAYALADRADDVKIGVKSTAVFFGSATRVFIAVLQTLFLLLMLTVGLLLKLGIWYYLSLGVALVCIVYQDRLLKTNNANAGFKAFLHNQWVGLSIFLGLVAQFYFKAL